MRRLSFALVMIRGIEFRRVIRKLRRGQKRHPGRRFVAAPPAAEKLGTVLVEMVRRVFQDWGHPAVLHTDNGTEFAEHHRLREKPGLQTFFCDPHAPWQKGGVENAIARLRRRLPRKTKLVSISRRQIASIAGAYNNTPRKCLDFKTPAEAFSILKSTVALQT